MPNEETTKKKTIKLPAYMLVEPDRVLLEKVAGKIGEYKVSPCSLQWCMCHCDGPFTHEIHNKVEKLTDLVNAKFGEIIKILLALKK